MAMDRQDAIDTLEQIGDGDLTEGLEETLAEYHDRHAEAPSSPEEDSDIGAMMEAGVQRLLEGSLLPQVPVLQGDLVEAPWWPQVENECGTRFMIPEVYAGDPNNIKILTDEEVLAVERRWLDSPMRNAQYDIMCLIATIKARGGRTRKVNGKRLTEPEADAPVVET